MISKLILCLLPSILISISKSKYGITTMSRTSINRYKDLPGCNTRNTKTLHLALGALNDSPLVIPMTLMTCI